MILYSTDQVFLPLVCISIASMVEHCRGNRPPVTVLLHDVDETARKGASSFLEELGLQLDLVDVDGSWCQPWAKARGQSPAKFGFLRMHELLQRPVGRVVVVDADTRFMDDVNKLLAHPLDGCAVAAVNDMAVVAEGRVPDLCAKLGIPQSPGYFNSGLLVIDLEKWLHANTGQAAIDVFTQRSEILTFNDQCALNAVLAGNFRQLPIRWNALQGTHRADWPVSMHHFAGHFKPWKMGLCRRLPSVEKIMGAPNIDFYRAACRSARSHNLDPAGNQLLETISAGLLLGKMSVNGRLRQHTLRSSSSLLTSFASQHPHLME
ncbi:glycosyltransferase family 8 protein [Anderseniella sp. Alg231-50]|uniref:glycosyltransferase family 8 protein n=1 Tax=Anderseniella sp. Alg231-50 TaxID=1922226 RepID=UPI00307C1599